jgi:D-aspartate ligase
MTSPTARAIVLGAGVTGLGTIRGLGRNGIPVWLAGAPPDFARRSRFVERYLPGLPPDADVESLAAFLDSLPVAEAVVVPCTDWWTPQISLLPAGIAERFRSSVPAPDLTRRLLDKWELSRLALEADVPHPRTFLLNKGEDLPPLADAEFGGFFLKPRDSQGFSERYHMKALSIGSAADARAHRDRLASEGFEMILQEYVGGPATNHVFIDGFVDARGKVLALFARRRIRMYPADYGNSSYVVSVRLEEVAPAADAMRRLLGAVGYRGIFSAEFKQDEADDVYKLLEVNVRPWWYIGFAADCGVNVAAMYYADALGREQEPVAAYRTGEGLVYTLCDFKAGVDAVRLGEFSLRAWLVPWLTSRRAIFDWRDPMPAIAQSLVFLRRRLRRALPGGRA